jgi:RND superfamily putative drug exporter
MSSAPQRQAGLLTRWARFATSRYKQVLIGWLLALVAIGGLVGAFGGTFVDAFSVPGTESQRSVDLLQERFPSQAGDSATMVFQSETGIADPAVQAEIDAVLSEAASLPHVIAVISPFDAQGQISQDGTIAYATLQYDKPGSEIEVEAVEELLAFTDRVNSGSLTVEVGGQVVSASERPETGTSELIGLGVAIIILLLTFGSVVAMGMPIITALVGVGLGFMGATLAAAFLDLSTISTAFISMIGLGVGIDYALFIVTRYREARASGLSTQNAVITAVDTAGRAVIFAGMIVIIALLGLFIVGIPFVGWMGAAGALVVFTSVLVANTLLPSLLTWVGPRIDKWSVPVPKPRNLEDTFGYKLTSRIQRNPLYWLAGGAVVIMALAAPVLDARVGTADAGNNPTSMHTRRAYDLLAQGFGPGFNGPLLVVINNDAGLAPEQTDSLSAAIASTGNVVFSSPATFNESGDTAIITVIPGSSPQDVATEDLITTLRTSTIPGVLGGTGTEAFVGGGTAAFVDISEKITDRLFIYIAIVAGLSIIVLMTVFRSVVIPIKAAILNLASFLAAYGVLVAVFQWGWGASLIGIDRTGPIESFLPLILFGILFGLSMDYEVFLISRVRESWIERGDNNWALSHGIGQTGRVILAAGAIMTSVFASFALGDSRTIKEFGIGLAAAILVDVAIVRMIIVPAAMSLFGQWNWWFPAWLDRILPRLDIEGADAHHPEQELIPELVPTPAD